jgi:hypothetical protein
MVVQAYNPYFLGGGYQEDNNKKCLISTSVWVGWHMPVIPMGSTNRRMMVQVGLSRKRDPISKMTTSKRDGRVAQVVEHLPTSMKP